MAHDDEDHLPVPEEGAFADRRAHARHRGRRIVGAAILGLLLLGLSIVWFARERIADDVIAGQLKEMGLPATYEVDTIGPSRQVLRNLVIGDPARPDLTVERVEAEIGFRQGVPAIEGVRLIRPRLYGSYRGGKLSFGSLDPLIFTDSKEPFRLPDLDLALVDGRGLIDSDYGPVGLKVDGKGALRSGFSGIVAAIAPQVRAGGCAATRASLYGRVRIEGEKPRFTGPLRIARLDCGEGGLALADAGVEIDMTADKLLDGVEGKAGLRTGALALGANRMAAAEGSGRFTFRKRALTARYELAGHAIAMPQVAAEAVTLEGVLRSGGGFARIETEGSVQGQGMRLGRDIDTSLAGLQQAGASTLAAPLVGQIRAGLLREGRGSSLTGSFLLRRARGEVNLVIPQANLRGGSGATLLSLSRFQYSDGARGTPRLAGNFATGGPDLPRIAGRMERRPGGELAMRMTMAEYRAGESRAAVPRLTVVQLASGALGFAGEVRLSGALPGGSTRNLALPLEGNWSAARGLALWRDCVEVGFDQLALANLTFDRRRLELCPPTGGAIVRSDAQGSLRVAAGVPALDVSGRLGVSPIRIRSGPLGFAYPGTLSARALDVELGPAATASRFRIANLDARLGSEVAGRFAGSDVSLAAVPLDILDASGTWRFAGGRLTLAEGAFRLEDRQVDDRFQPLLARGATLSLYDNRIIAEAILREPASEREVVRTAIRHDLGAGSGSADLFIDGIRFDKQLQPDTLSRLALGIIANAEGTVHGSGRIGWNEDAVTSSGSFTTDSLDFAAAFGPVQGVSGTVVFTDLLGMVTAPDQSLRIAAINPGIEVNDGVLVFDMRPGNLLSVKGASWPFLDGRLQLLPVDMKLGVAETRRYTLVIDGLNAARFLERVELANISATGVFDGTMPLVFDENGGRIEGGMLASRPPGGNVSYVGALSYKDLSTMANYAFDTLKSLNYREMTIGMDGALDGEIVTRVRFTGVGQGQGAKRNFLTKQVARLPIQFHVNLRAPFFQLVSSFKSLYDPSFVRDPRSLGLIDVQGRPVARPSPGAPPAVPPASSPSAGGAKPDIQP